MGFKRSKIVCFLLVSALCAAGLMLWCHFSVGYYTLFEVTYGKYDAPLITTQLQGQRYTLAVRIGSRFPLFLHQDILNEIDKEPQGTLICHNIEGQKRETPSYLIPELKVGDLILKNIIACASDEHECGILGKLLGGEFNLLLDFPHSRMVACDTFSKLQARKLAGPDWVRAPFEAYNLGIIFHVDTDFGALKLAINTTSRLNLLNSTFLSSNKPFVSSSFILGGQQLGNVTFGSIDLPEGLREIDGFIGMDFLKEHAVYLDYTNKIAYVEPTKKYFERIPVTLGLCNEPVIDLSIEDKVYPLKLDLGSAIFFSLEEEILQNIDKLKYGTFKWYDFRGKQYESPTYTIPEAKIGNLKFTNVLVNQDSMDFHTNVTFNGPPLQLPGMIGSSILEKYNLFLDFAHDAIYASRDHLSLQQRGLLSNNLLAIPFTLHPDGIILSVQTDGGIYRLMLDTGATFTIIRAPHSDITEKFCIMGHDFGKRSIKVLDVHPRFDFDGCLGMDFLCEYPLFIDYPNKMIFIDLQTLL